jgi:hypothetical protein
MELQFLLVLTGMAYQKVSGFILEIMYERSKL